MATLWGIVGAGKISHDFLTAMGTLAIGDHRVVAVAARDRERAMEFGKTHKVEKVLNSYEELAKDVEVEVSGILSDCLLTVYCRWSMWG